MTHYFLQLDDNGWTVFREKTPIGKYPTLEEAARAAHAHAGVPIKVCDLIVEPAGN